MALHSLERDPIPREASLIYSGTDVPILEERLVLEPVFGRVLAYGRLSSGGGGRFVDWGIGPASICDPSPEFSDQLSQRTAEAGGLVVELKRILAENPEEGFDSLDEMVSLHSEEFQRLAGVLRKKERRPYEAHGAVLVERTRLLHAEDVLRKAIGVLEVVSEVQVANQEGELRVVRWGWRTFDPDAAIPPPRLQYWVEPGDAESDTSLHFKWDNHPAYGLRALQRTESNPDDGGWEQVQEFNPPEVAVDASIPSEQAFYRLSVMTAQGEMVSLPVEVRFGVAASKAPEALPLPEVSVHVHEAPDGEEPGGELSVAWVTGENVRALQGLVASVEWRAGEDGDDWRQLGRCAAGDGALSDLEGDPQSSTEYRVRFELDEGRVSDWGYATHTPNDTPSRLPSPIVGVETQPADEEEGDESGEGVKELLAVTWNAPVAEGESDPGWNATVEKHSSKDGDWQPLGTCRAAQERFVDPEGDPSVPARYRVLFTHGAATSTWGETRWSPANTGGFLWSECLTWLLRLLVVALIIWLIYWLLQSGCSGGDRASRVSRQTEVIDQDPASRVLVHERPAAEPQAEPQGEGVVSPELPIGREPPVIVIPPEAKKGTEAEPPPEAEDVVGSESGLSESEVLERRLGNSAAVTGAVDVALMWGNRNDLDLIVKAPSGELIFFQAQESRCGGKLDVDSNASAVTEKPVEHIAWNEAPAGRYEVYVLHYRNRELPGCKDPTAYSVRVKAPGIEDQVFPGELSHSATQTSEWVTTFEVEGHPASPVEVPDRESDGASKLDALIPLLRDSQAQFKEGERIQSGLSDLEDLGSLGSKEASEKLSSAYVGLSEGARTSGIDTDEYEAARGDLSEVASSMANSKDEASREVALDQLAVADEKLETISEGYAEEGKKKIEEAQELVEAMAQDSGIPDSVIEEVEQRLAEAQSAALEERGEVIEALDAVIEAAERVPAEVPESMDVPGNGGEPEASREDEQSARLDPLPAEVTEGEPALVPEPALEPLAMNETIPPDGSILQSGSDSGEPQGVPLALVAPEDLTEAPGEGDFLELREAPLDGLLDQTEGVPPQEVSAEISTELRETLQRIDDAEAERQFYLALVQQLQQTATILDDQPGGREGRQHAQDRLEAICEDNATLMQGVQRQGFEDAVAELDQTLRTLDASAGDQDSGAAIHQVLKARGAFDSLVDDSDLEVQDGLEAAVGQAKGARGSGPSSGIQPLRRVVQTLEDAQSDRARGQNIRRQVRNAIRYLDDSQMFLLDWQHGAIFSSSVKFQEEGRPFEILTPGAEYSDLMDRLVWGVSIRIDSSDPDASYGRLMAGWAEEKFTRQLEQAGITLRDDVYISPSDRAPSGAFWVHLQFQETAVSESRVSFDSIPGGPRLAIRRRLGGCTVEGALAHWWFGIRKADNGERGVEWAKGLRWVTGSVGVESPDAWEVMDKREVYRIAFRAREVSSAMAVVLLDEDGTPLVRCSPLSVRRFKQ